jgi:hypothetical protein
VALSARLAATPTSPSCVPGLAIVGAVAGFGTAAMPRRTILATDGTPASLKTNSK